MLSLKSGEIEVQKIKAACPKLYSEFMAELDLPSRSPQVRNSLVAFTRVTFVPAQQLPHNPGSAKEKGI